VIVPEQITLVDGSVEDLVEEAMENSAVSNSVPESESEGEGEGEGFAEEATAERNDELIEDDSPELVADAEVAEEAVAATV
jgi:hypothetical protein